MTENFNVGLSDLSPDEDDDEQSEDEETSTEDETLDWQSHRAEGHRNRSSPGHGAAISGPPSSPRGIDASGTPGAGSSGGGSSSVRHPVVLALQAPGLVEAEKEERRKSSVERRIKRGTVLGRRDNSIGSTGPRNSTPGATGEVLMTRPVSLMRTFGRAHPSSGLT